MCDLLLMFLLDILQGRYRLQIDLLSRIWICVFTLLVIGLTALDWPKREQAEAKDLGFRVYGECLICPSVHEWHCLGWVDPAWRSWAMWVVLTSWCVLKLTLNGALLMDAVCWKYAWKWASRAWAAAFVGRLVVWQLPQRPPGVTSSSPPFP